MGFWDGMFFKHRDYLHGSFFEHARANGVRYRIAAGRPVLAKRDPITMTALDAPRLAFIIRLLLAAGAYDYFVLGDEEPTEEEIKDFIDKLNTTALPEGVRRDAEEILTEGGFNDYLEIIEDDSLWEEY